jgi:hypothetical protein
VRDTELLHRALFDELEKIAIDLTAAGRAQIAKKNFALTSKQSTTGKPAYPIHDATHARAALRLVGMHGSEQQKAEVRKDVARKYPGMVRDKVAGIVGNIRQAVKSPGVRDHLTEIGGLGVLAVPGIDTLQARARARMAGDTTPGAAKKRQLMGEGGHAALDVAGLGALMAPEFKHLRHG